MRETTFEIGRWNKERKPFCYGLEDMCYKEFVPLFGMPEENYKKMLRYNDRQTEDGIPKWTEWQTKAKAFYNQRPVMADTLWVVMN